MFDDPFSSFKAFACMISMNKLNVYILQKAVTMTRQTFFGWSPTRNLARTAALPSRRRTAATTSSAPSVATTSAGSAWRAGRSTARPRAATSSATATQTSLRNLKQMSPTMDIKKQCIGKSFFLKKVFFLLCNSNIF